MLEIRMTDAEGKLIRTNEDTTVPRIREDFIPNAMFLGEYCFDQRGPWIKSKQLLKPRDVAAIVYNRKGQIESMVVGEDQVEPSRAHHYLPFFTRNILTRYPGQDGKEIFMFHLSPDTKRRLECQIQK